MNVDSFKEFLQPTQLCDFNTEPGIKDTALRLTDTKRQVEYISEFIRELPYRSDDWGKSGLRRL